eukprot:2096458-Amphidinium_carterae.1
MADVAANNGTRDVRVRLPALEPEPPVVVAVELVALPAAPFVVGPHQRVVEHETYAICLDCSRQRHPHCHALKGRPCQPLTRKKRVRLDPGFGSAVHIAAPGGVEPLPADVG